MTKRELIEQLEDPAKAIPDDAVIMAFNGDSGQIEAITGMLYGPNKDGTYQVEVCTDDVN